jgi:aryl-alcohol dehydrogenase-like predicted oxidoreductase
LQGSPTLERALELGITFLDTAEVYGPYTNEELLGRFLKGNRKKVELATKFGFKRDPNDATKIGLDGSPANARKAIEGSLKRLQTEVVDLSYRHRVDPATPIEDTVGAMAQLVKEGKVRYLGLSEASAETLRISNTDRLHKKEACYESTLQALQVGPAAA